ncbi:MAG: response regulator, partial [Deltaproteobacteria bacterium]|nr:response regulator [Deltaproteobacteria bacterium]
MEKKILIVDDEFNTRFTVDLALSTAGYTTAQATSAAEALCLLEQSAQECNPFHLLITDIQMPDMSGIELIDKMKEKQIHLPSLVITGFGDKSTLIELIKRRCNYYLDKPFSPNDLLAAVNHIFEKTAEDHTSLNALKQQLIHSEKMSMLGRITPQVAHEINNPAQVIQGFAELLLEDKSIDLKSKDMIKMMRDAVKSIVQLNRSLLDLSKPVHRKIARFRPEEPLKKAIDFLTQAGVIKHCRILKNYQNETPHVQGDMMQLH